MPTLKLNITWKFGLTNVDPPLKLSIIDANTKNTIIEREIRTIPTEVSVTLPIGTYAVSVKHPQFRPVGFTIELKRDLTKTITIQPAAFFR